MKLLICVVILALSLTLTLACVTPKGEPGQCIKVRDCAFLVKMLQQRPIEPDDYEYLTKSSCGFDGRDPKACCPMSTETSTPVKPITNSGSITSRNPNGLSSRLLPTKSDCSVDNSDRIVGGEVADLRDFPWMALLEYQKPNGKGFYCGGVLINDRYVLTAAHCMKGKDLPKTWRLSSVRLGEYDVESDEDCVTRKFSDPECADPVVDVPVDELIPHEQYNPNDANQFHDIALIRLARKVKYTDFIKPICIATSFDDLSKQYTDKTLFVAGWGKTETRSQSDIKLKLKVPVKSNAQCNNVYQRARVNLGSGQMCAGGEKGKDSCRGDSGGPLMALESDSNGNLYWLVSGVVSFGPTPCGMQGWPGVYTRVSEYADWIISKLRP